MEREDPYEPLEKKLHFPQIESDPEWDHIFQFSCTVGIARVRSGLHKSIPCARSTHSTRRGLPPASYLIFVCSHKVSKTSFYSAGHKAEPHRNQWHAHLCPQQEWKLPYTLFLPEFTPSLEPPEIQLLVSDGQTELVKQTWNGPEASMAPKAPTLVGMQLPAFLLRVVPCSFSKQVLPSSAGRLDRDYQFLTWGTRNTLGRQSIWSFLPKWQN